MKTAKDSRLNLVRDQYVLNNIHSLNDIYAVIPLRALSAATGISTGRLNNPESLHIGDIIQAATLIKIPPDFLFKLFDQETPFTAANLDLSEREKFRLKLLRDSIGLGSIRTLSQVLDVIPRSVIAVRIGTNNNNMRDFILNPEPYNVQFVQRVAWGLKITPGMLFGMIHNQLQERKSRKPVKIKLEMIQSVEKEETVVYIGARKI